MPTSSGQYFLPPVYLATPGEVIRANQHNVPLEDIAQGLTDRMMRDGSTPMLADLPMNGYRIRGVAAATAASDVPRYDQVTKASSFLNSVSDLALAANDLIYAVDANTAGKTTLTAFARTLIAGGDAPAMRSTLGLGALATKDQAAIVADTTGTLPVSRGGTGSTTAAGGAAGLQAVSYGAAQTLTEPQKAQARDNIDAVAIADLPEVPVEVPIGTIMHFAADTPPGGWLVCDGTAVTSLYPDLRAFLLDAGSPYGLSGADPRLPDLRGEFVRGWDGGRGVDAGRVFGSAQEDDLKAHQHVVYVSGSPGSRTDAFDVDDPNSGTNPAEKPTSEVGGTETRPRNIALLPCIRAYASVVNVPGQADLDNILQQTQVQVDDALDRVVGDATAAAEAKVSWKRVGKVPVGTGAAVTITGLDLAKETMFIVSFVKNSGTASSALRLRASEDGGASWGPGWEALSASANWSAGTLRGAIELLPDSANGIVIASSLLSGAVGANAQQYAPGEVVSGGVPVLTPASDAVEFFWSGGNFAASGAPVPEPDCIIIYQRG